MAQHLEITAKRSTLFFVGFLLAITFSIDAGGSSRAQGLLEIQITDHRDAIDDFSRLDLSVEKILLSPRPGLKFWQSGWKELPVNAGSIDLTKYVGKRGAIVYRGQIDAAWFDAFHLKLKSSDGILKSGQRSIRIKHNLNPVKLAFEVPAQGETRLVIDLVVTDFSDHPPRGYELNLRGYEVYTNGKLVDKIPPA